MPQSDPKRKPAPSYSQVVLRGSESVVRGFLSGLAMGSGECLPHWFFEDEHVDVPEDSPVHQAASFLHLAPHEVYVVAAAPLVKALRKAEKEARARGLCEVVDIAKIRSASFEARYKAYAPRYDMEIQDRLDDLPRGLKRTDDEREVRSDPDAEGVEAYTPVHDFESRGRCHITGRIDLVIAKRKQLDEHPLIEVGEIELTLA